MQKKCFRILILANFLMIATAEQSVAEENKSDHPFSQAKFVPDISLIIDFSFNRFNLNADDMSSLEIPGFSIGGGAASGQNIGSAGNGFNFNYGELAIGATVDPYFDLFTNFHLGQNHFEIEEAYIRTRSLPLGLKLKAGKFLSDFGRLNSQHAHFWNFNEAPLVHQVFFGDEGLNEKGIQLSWISPFPFFLELGIEALQGENETSFGTQGWAGVQDAPVPNLAVGFVKTSFDWKKLITLIGFSFASGKSRIPEFNAEATGFAGNTSIWGVDFTLKYLIDSYRSVTFQGEWIGRQASGQEWSAGLDGPLEKSQAGAYLEAVWRFQRQFRWGVRGDFLNHNDIRQAGVHEPLPSNLTRYTLMVEYIPTEFSRLRIEYVNDHSHFSAAMRKTVNELVFSLNIAIGAHGAHAF